MKIKFSPLHVPEIRRLLNNYVLEVSFVKKDGTSRTMIATTNPLYLPEVKSEGNKRTKKTSDTLITCYDIEAPGWRSFNIESLVSYVVTDRPTVVTSETTTSEAA